MEELIKTLAVSCQLVYFFILMTNTHFLTSEIKQTHQKLKIP